LEAKALQQELLSEVREAELAKKKIERDIREAETRRRVLNEQASVGRNYIDDLQSGSFGAVNAAKKFLDNSGKSGQPSKLDLERERLELELEQLKSQQKAQETTKLLTTYGGIATALGVAANVLNGNGELGELGTASGLRQAFPSTSKYLTDLSANNNQQIAASAKKMDAGNNVPMPYLDAKIEELEKKVKTERDNVKEEARELDRLSREKEEARKKGLPEAEEKEKKEAKEKSEKEAKEKTEKEAKFKAEKEAKEKAEKETIEKAEKEAKEKAAKEKAEKEAKEKAEKETKEKAEREAKEKSEKEAKEKSENEAKVKAEKEDKEKAEDEAKAKVETKTKEDEKGSKRKD